VWFRKLALAGVLSAVAGLASTSRAIETEALLDSLQHGAFEYFWNEANPSNGLVKDRSTPGSPCSIAAVGFGLSAICIGIDHGWVSREDGRDRVTTTLETFWNAPQGDGASGFIGYKGLYYHFLDMNTATRTWDSELSTIDSALLFAGVLDAKQYFSTDDPGDEYVRALADSIYYRADWEFVRNGANGIRMGWKPGTLFSGYGLWVGYNEAMILYLLALGSPTFPVPELTWDFWTAGYDWATQYGQTYVNFPPLFGHQYSHCWIDFRGIRDGYMQMPNHNIDYFENSRRATIAQREYCIANPGGWIGYSADLWGLTASDDPSGYLAHGAPPPQNDNGTITPTAAASSIAFAPEIVIPTLHYMYDSYYSQLWSTYGFKDAFNLTVAWWATDYLGIDQGPIIIMIENYLNGSVWSRFMQNPDVLRGLSRAGFDTVTGVGEPSAVAVAPRLRVAPNPFRRSTTVTYDLERSGPVSLVVYDAAGRLVTTLLDGPGSAGEHAVSMDGRGLPSGVYYYVLTSAGTRVGARSVLVR
jgi:hypothetical protein